MSRPDTRDLTADECRSAMPTSRCLYGEFGPQLWVLPDGDAVAGMPRPGRYLRRELQPGAAFPCPYLEREPGQPEPDR